MSIERLAEWLAAALAGLTGPGLWLAPLLALVGGVLTAANPCVIGMVPVMLAFVAGPPAATPRRPLLMSLAFAGGLTLTFTGLFVAAWLARGIARSAVWSYVAAAVCLAMGLQMLGVLKLELPVPAWSAPAARGPLGALLLGVLFGFTSLPCAGPVLVALLAVAATTGAAFGALLVAAYGLGHCALVIAAGTSWGLVERTLASRGLVRALERLHLAAGVLVLGVGLYLLATA
ncbi:MAG: sulfite exporter TauE/SafE family protein [Vicinamibacteria bacterium]|nr:sulfite exporter TauE/SafE family protein [Vicinamibacteria bacterium]